MKPCSTRDSRVRSLSPCASASSCIERESQLLPWRLGWDQVREEWNRATVGVKCVLQAHLHADRSSHTHPLRDFSSFRHQTLWMGEGRQQKTLVLRLSAGQLKSPHLPDLRGLLQCENMAPPGDCDGGSIPQSGHCSVPHSSALGMEFGSLKFSQNKQNRRRELSCPRQDHHICPRSLYLREPLQLGGLSLSCL